MVAENYVLYLLILICPLFKIIEVKAIALCSSCFTEVKKLEHRQFRSHEHRSREVLVKILVKVDPSRATKPK